jgi:dTDP-glucose 4,6-dehydratase
VASQAPKGEVYHFSTEHVVSIRELVEKVCTRLNVKFESVVETVEDRPGNDAAYLLDSTKARQMLRWRDVIGLDEGIEETVRWVADNIDELKRQPVDYIHKP